MPVRTVVDRAKGAARAPVFALQIPFPPETIPIDQIWLTTTEKKAS